MFRPSPTALRLSIAVAGAVLALGDLLIKAAAVDALRGGARIRLRVIDLWLAYNPGVAFSLGDALPTWVVVGTTGAIVVALAVVALYLAPRWSLLAWIGASAVLGGALGNLIDRATDGVVTDYLHTGWFPTFNLADVLITAGVILSLPVVLRNGAGSPNVEAISAEASRARKSPIEGEQ